MPLRPRSMPLLAVLAVLAAGAAGAQTSSPPRPPALTAPPRIQTPAPLNAQVQQRVRLVGDLRARIAASEREAAARRRAEADRAWEQRRLALGYTHRYAQGEDCDDTRREVHPGAAEVCDYRDNDCNGVIDDGQRLAFFLDADGDGHGDPAQRVDACPAEQARAAASGRWLVLVGNDCDDRDPARWQRCE